MQNKYRKKKLIHNKVELKSLQLNIHYLFQTEECNHLPFYHKNHYFFFFCRIKMMFANNSKYIFEGARISGGDHLVSLSTFMSSNDHWNFTSNSKKDWNLILTHIQHISRSLLAHDTCGLVQLICQT